MARKGKRTKFPKSPLDIIKELLPSSKNYDTHKDGHGNDTRRNGHGNRNDRNVHGNTPKNGHGNDKK